MASSTTAYSRPSKLPGGAGGDRRPPPRLIRGILAAKIEPRKLAAGLLAGCCLALLTYVSLSKLYAVYSPVFATTSALLQNSPPSSSAAPGAEAAPRAPQEPAFTGSKNGSTVVDRVDLTEKPPAMAGSQEPGVPRAVSRKDDAGKAPAPANISKPMPPSEEPERKNTSVAAGPMRCDENGVDEGFPYARPAVCELSGDIRVSPSQKTMYLINPTGGGGFDDKGEKRIRPYARNDDFLLPAVVEVTVKSVPSSEAAPQCTKQHRVPAVVFSVAGYTDNFFHDNTDVMIPLFMTTAHLKGEVQLLITNYKPWWVQKYTPVLRKLSNYDVINFDDDADVHCFPRGYLGLYRDRDLIIAPHQTRNPHNYTMVDYNRFLRAAYGLRRDQPAFLGVEPGMQPRMLIISRSGTRKLLNQEEVAAAASEIGFNVTVAEAGADVPAFAALVNSVDVLLAVHGAGLTNVVFLPESAVVVQIVPWGNMEWQATNFYGQPARDMGLRYVEYYVDEEETSLKDKYPRDHVVFKDPKALHTQGWQVLANTIMKQDVKVNLTRFQPFLLQAMDELQE